MIKKNINKGVLYLTFPELLKYPFINHAFSPKVGGVSKDEFSSMNLSFNRGDSDENVIENYKRLCDACNFNFDNLVASNQVHGTNVRVVSKKDYGKGILKPKFLECVDGLITNEKDVVLVTYFADCVPIFFIDIKKKVIGLTHAGWRGTVNLIAKTTVDKMLEEYNCDFKDIICAIGPSIGKCCYEVDDTVKSKVDDLKLKESTIKKVNDSKYMLDLWQTNRQILINCGIPDENIILSNMCTSCNSDILFSHRVTKGKRGGMAAFLSLV